MNEASPHTVHGTRAMRTVGITVAAMLGTLVVLVSLFFAWFALPRFTATFADLDIEMPALTVYALNYGPVMIPLAALLWAAAAVGCAALPMPAPLRGVAAAVLLFALAVFVLLLALAVFLPLSAAAHAI